MVINSGASVPTLTYWWSRLIPTIHLTPRRITGGYLVFGLFALYISDVVLISYLSEPLLSEVQTVKGVIEVFLTAGLIFVLTTRREAQLKESRFTLEQKQNELQVLHRVLRHNLRNDVNVIQAYAQMLREQVSPEQLTKQCEKMLEVADRISRYTEKAKKIERVADPDDQVITYNATSLVREALEENEYVTDAVDISIDTQDSILVCGGPALREALGELISNAVKHNDSRSPRIGVSIGVSRDRPHMAEIRISDNGSGMPEHEIKALEGRGEDPLIHSSGLGLWIAKWIVINADGELVIRDNEWGGTTVVAILPRASSAGKNIKFGP